MRSSEHSAPKDSHMMMAAIYRGPSCQILRIKDRMSPADIFRKISRLWHDVDQSKHMITYFSPYDRNMRVRLVDDVDVECMLDVYRMMKIPLMPLKLETIESQSTDKGGMTLPTENPNDDNSQRGSDDCPGGSSKKYPSRSARRKKAKRKWWREWKSLVNLHLLFGNLQEAQTQRPDEDSHEDSHDHDEVLLDNEGTAEEIEMRGANLFEEDQILGKRRRKKAKRKWLRELKMRVQHEAQRQSPEDSHEDLHDRDDGDPDNGDTEEEMEMEEANLLQMDQTPEKDGLEDFHDRVEMDRHIEVTGEEINMEGSQSAQKAQIPSRSVWAKKAKRKWIQEHKILTARQEAQRQSHEDLHDRDEGDLDNGDTAEEMEMEDANLLQMDQTPEKDGLADFHDRVEMDRHNEVTGEGINMEGSQLSQKAQIPSRSARRKKAKRKWIQEHKILIARQEAQRQSPGNNHEDLHDRDEGDMDNGDTAEEMEMDDANLLQMDQIPEKDGLADLHDRVEMDRHNEATGEGINMEGSQSAQKAQIQRRSARRKKAKRKWIRELKILTARQHAQSQMPEKDRPEEGHDHGEVNLVKENAGE